MMHDATIFVILVLVSFLAFLVVHPFTMVGGDEGRFVQDALRIGRGEIPIADYGTRAPILSFFINLSAELFGHSLFIFRLPVLLFSALTAGFIFLLGKELFSRNVGILASLVYASVPFTLWNNSVIKSEALSMLLTLIAALFLIRGLRNHAWRWFLLSGCAMGLAYIERHTIVVFMLTSALMVVWEAIGNQWSIDRRALRIIVTHGMLIVLGVILGFLPIFSFIAYYNSDRAIEAWLSFVPIAVGASTKVVSYAGAVPTLYGFLRSWALSFVENLAVQAGLLFIGFVFFLLAVIQLLLGQHTTLRRILMIGTVVIFFGSFAGHALNIYRMGTFRPGVFLALLLFSLPLFFILLFYEIYQQRSRDFFLTQQNSIAFLCFWIGAHILAFSFYAPGYMRELIPQLSLAGGVLLGIFPWRRAEKIVVTVFFISLGGLFGVSVSWFSDPVTGRWWWQKTITDTAAFLESHTAPGEQVFAANALPVILAERRTVADITSYAMVFVKDPNERHGTFPSPHEMLMLLEKNQPRYTLVDG